MIFPDGPVKRWGARELVKGDHEMLYYTSWDGVTKFHVAGPTAPTPGVQDGVVLVGDIKNLMPGFDHISQKTARQAGSTWMGAVYDELKASFKVQVHSRTPRGLSEALSQWKAAWRPDRTGKLEWITQDRGYWYCTPRLGAPWADAQQRMRAVAGEVELTHQILHDEAFWFGMPSFSTFAPGVSDAQGFLTLANIGDQDAPVQLLCYGPGLFSFSNGPSTGTETPITFGPLLPGQIALIDTRARVTQVVDITAGTPQLAVTPDQKLIESIVNFVTNNNVPPVLRQFESEFGIAPPQGPLYSLLNGLFTNLVPGVAQPRLAQPQHIAVSITAGSPASKVVARLDPMRVSPE
ncbi:hypothetical protein [Mycolicibacter heraklionensis]|uniref:hypothetical protein n=1 Tax=Mycolicibacter heraklionensis TaxID=512402 RepID=UPI00069A3983|nr:hypothetical protein [Mycolicibacter heraklionensis]